MRLAVAVCVCLVVAAPAPALVAQDAMGQARQLRMGGRPSEAADVLDRALRSTPNDESMLGLYGLCLLDAGRTAEAVALVERIGAYAGRDPRLNTTVGRVRRLQGDSEGAVRAFRAALASKPDAVEASVELVGAHLAENRFGAALAAAEALEQFVPDMGRRLAAQALAAHAHKHHMIGEESLGAAIGKYREALAKTPEDTSLGRQLVECLLQAIRVDEAREQIGRTFSGDVHRVERLYYEARCLDALSDARGARALYLKVLDEQPGHAPTLLELAKLDLDDGRPADTKSWLAQMPPDGGSARSQLLLGLAELGLGNDEAAEAALRQSLVIDPGRTNTKAMYHLGRLLVRTGRPEEGRRYLSEVAAAQR
jgi:tetratricopeptide (TPR) repeat protein